MKKPIPQESIEYYYQQFIFHLKHIRCTIRGQVENQTNMSIVTIASLDKLFNSNLRNELIITQQT